MSCHTYVVCRSMKSDSEFCNAVYRDDGGCFCTCWRIVQWLDNSKKGFLYIAFAVPAFVNRVLLAIVCGASMPCLFVYLSAVYYIVLCWIMFENGITSEFVRRRGFSRQNAWLTVTTYSWEIRTSSSSSSSSFLQRVSIACYAKRCISYRKFCPTVCLTVWPSVRHTLV